MLVLVDKPSGWTSHDVVKYIKVHGGFKKVGHAGTLDPLATGLLMILTDDDTKRMADLVGEDKTYVTTIDLSHISDTWDRDSHALYEEVPVAVPPSQEQVDAVLQSFVGNPQLPIPSFSAKKQGGRRLYKDARQGIDHGIMKEMPIHKLVLESYMYPYAVVRCDVGSGTFIRSIAHELGERLHTGGIVHELRRETIGSYSVFSPSCIPDIVAHKRKSGSNSDILSADEPV